MRFSQQDSVATQDFDGEGFCAPYIQIDHFIYLREMQQALVLHNVFVLLFFAELELSAIGSPRPRPPDSPLHDHLGVAPPLQPLSLSSAPLSPSLPPSLPPSRADEDRYGV